MLIEAGAMHLAEDTIGHLGAHGGSGSPAFTYSDLTQRLIPAAVLAAFPAKPLTADILLDVASRLAPTPEFRETP
jgi:hypothetical protein